MWKHIQLIPVSTSTHLNRPLWYIKGTWSWVSHQKTFCSFQGEMVHDLTTIWEPTRAGGTVSRRGRKIVLWRGYGRDDGMGRSQMANKLARSFRSSRTKQAVFAMGKSHQGLLWKVPSFLCSSSLSISVGTARDPRTEEGMLPRKTDI